MDVSYNLHGHHNEVESSNDNNSDSYEHISLIEDTLADIRKANKAGGNYAGQFVVYDLPERDCAAAASNGEYSLDDDGETKYMAYIDKIKTILQTYSDIRILLVIGKNDVPSVSR